MTIWKTKCTQCQQVTPHAEDAVADSQSATVWHCLFCGTERRPEEPGGHNMGSKLPKPIKPVPEDKALV